MSAPTAYRSMAPADAMHDLERFAAAYAALAEHLDDEEPLAIVADVMEHMVGLIKTPDAKAPAGLASGFGFLQGFLIATVYAHLHHTGVDLRPQTFWWFTLDQEH